MTDTISTDPRQLLAELLREVLPRLYDPAWLQRSPLLGVLTKGHSAKELHDVLVRAIAALQPGPDVPDHAVLWRNYHVLTYRFVEQSPQTEVAEDLNVSVRQLRRYEQMAVDALADALWRERNLSECMEQFLQSHGRSEEAPEAAQGRDQELAWLRQSFPRVASSPQDLVRNVLRTIYPLADKMAVRLTCYMPEDLPPIAGQLAALRQALINLLTAAVHSAPGGVVHLAGRADEGGLALLVRATSPTTQGETDSSAVVDESLSMARQLAEAFGATLTVRPKWGDSNERLFARMLLAQAREMQVLFVDDNADALRLFERYLEGTRYRMLPISEPERALDIASEARPDAIVLDVMIPGMDGWELLGRLREHPATCQIPVLVCTILPQEGLALALGAAAFIRKPISREAFLAALNRVLP